MADYSYKLTLGNKVTAPEATIDKITLDQSADTVFTKDSDEFDMRLHGFSIHKKIYQPNHIEAEVTFTKKESSSTNFPAFSDISSEFNGRLVSVQASYQEKAEENYYVQDVIPLLTTDSSGNTSLSVKLNIFSLDKLMTLNKYSKAYVARKLGSGILKIEARNFGYTNATEKTPLIKTDITGMQILRYNQAVTVQLPNNKTATTYIPSEFIHPYLMQYNESFYDFMARCANRFGEFLYFEDGKLNLGLDTSSTATEIAKFETVTAQDSTDGIFDVESYRRDSVKDNDNAPKNLNQTFIKKDHGFPSDAFPKTNQYVYNTEAVNDEYLFPLYKDKFTDYLREMNFDGATSGSDGDKAAAFLIPFTKNLLKNEEAMLSSGLTASFVQAAIDDFSFKSLLSLNSIDQTNKKMNKAYIDSLKKQTEQTDGNKAVQFGSVDSSGWFTLDYYNQIHKPQTKVQHEIICIDMGTDVLNVKLGQKIKVNSLGDSEYIVIQILQNSEIAWAHNYDQYNNKTDNQVKAQQSLRIYAIPISTITDKNNEKSTKYLPPIQTAPIIRKAGPQTAFVTDNGDPKRQGRVRVMYPWQTSSELIKLKEQATISDTNKTTASNNEKDAKKKLEDLEKKWKTDYQRLQDVVKFLKELAGDRSTILSKIDERKTELQNDYNDKLLPEYNKQEAIIKSHEAYPITKYIAKNDLEKVQEKMKENRAEYHYLEQQKEDFEKAHNDKVIDSHANTPVDKDKYDDNTNPVVVELTTSLEETRLELAEARREYEEAAIELNKQKKEDDEINNKIATVYKTLSSPWIRVATPMATSGGGAYFKPQKGDEVLVDYDNGNIERPYVMGSLFSKNVLEPQEYLGRKNTQGGGNATMAIVSPNGHHITFSDPSGNLDFFSKGIFPGMGMYAGLLDKKYKDDDNLKDLGGGIHIGDRYGIYEIDMKSQNRSISIKSPFGTIDLNAFNGITINAPNGDVRIKGKNISLEAGNKISVTSGTNIPNSSDDSIGILMGKAAIKTVVSDLTKTYVTSLVDLSLVRSVIETFARPVDGTLLLKSKKYLKLEAGKGKANVAMYRYRKLPDDKQYLTKQFYTIIINHVRFMVSMVDAYFSTYKELCGNAREAMRIYNRVTMNKLTNSNDPNIPEFAYKEREKEIADNFKSTILENKFIIPRQIRDIERDFLPYANSYKKSIHEVYRFTLGEFLERNFIINKDKVPEEFQFLAKASERIFTSYDQPTWIMKQINKWTDKYKNGANLHFLDDGQDPDDPFNESKKNYFKRAAILTFLYFVYKEQEEANKFHKLHPKRYLITSYSLNFDNLDIAVDSEWRKILSKISKESKMGAIMQALWDASVQKVIDSEGSIKDTIKCLYDKEVWDDTQGGQILFSESDDATLHFNDNQIEKEELNEEFSNLKDFLTDLD